jgi:F-type H+-transporting ATPase subunit a
MNPLQTRILFHVGPVAITEPVVTTWGIIAVLGLFAFVTTRRPALVPSRAQAVAEVAVESLANTLEDVLHRDPKPFLPLLGTLFVFIVVSNLASLVPGVRSPTAHLETDAALAIVVYLSAHGYGIRSRGLRKYLHSYIEPSILLLPLNVLSELTRSFSLTVRLFGNVMSHELVIGIVLSLAGLLVPIPLMALGALLGIVQAYIFTILATVAVGGAIGSVEKG